MKAVVGSSRQEVKIAEMGDVAHQRFPRISILAFKGAFRRTVRETLRKQGEADWETVASRPAPARRAFFERVLSEMPTHLKRIGLDEKEIGRLQASLRVQNEKYLIS